MKLRRDQDIALLFLSELASLGKGELASLATIVKKHGLSLLFLKNIVRKLKNAGFISSKEGVGGGYMLALPSDAITVHAVLQSLVQDYKKEAVQNATNSMCPLVSRCLPQSIRHILSTALENGLSHITIADFTHNGKDRI